MDRVTRFGVSIPSKQVKRFDEAISRLGYTKRSKAIADAINDFILQRQPGDEGRQVIGSICFLYDHHVSDVNKKLVKVQHKNEGLIKSTMHSHITHEECVEVLIVEGKADSIQELYGSISATRGVINCKLVVLGSR